MTSDLSQARKIVASISSEDSSVVSIRVEAGHPGDSLRGFVLTKGGKRHRIACLAVRGSLGIAGVTQVLKKARPTKAAPIVVLAERMGPELRQTLLGHGLGYIDAAGNCHLELDGGRVVVHIEGKRGTPPTPGSTTLRDAGYRVLFALLAQPELLEHSVREVEALANASRHAVAQLLARLREEGTLVRAGRSKHVFAPGGKAACIDRFATGWADVLRNRLLVGRFRLREGDPEAVERTLLRVLQAERVPFGFGGTAGAARLTNYHRGAETAIHADDWNAELSRQLGAVPDRQGPLVVFRTMGQLDLQSAVPATAHPLLVHAELARSPEPRAREAAAVVLERLLRDTTA